MNWINAEERQPICGSRVLVFKDWVIGGEQEVMLYNKDGMFESFSEEGGEYECGNEIKWWMPLPENPINN